MSTFFFPMIQTFLFKVFTFWSYGQRSEWNLLHFRCNSYKVRIPVLNNTVDQGCPLVWSLNSTYLLVCGRCGNSEEEFSNLCSKLTGVFCLLNLRIKKQGLNVIRNKKKKNGSFNRQFQKCGFRNCISVCAQSCLSLCDPIDSSLPGSSIHGIFQARILEWVVISSSRGSSPFRD